METKHTAGPWADCGQSVVSKTTRHVVCFLPTQESPEYTEEIMEANARLIAAAPDMLESIQELLDHIEWRRRTEGETTGPNDCTLRARAVIAKATQC